MASGPRRPKRHFSLAADEWHAFCSAHFDEVASQIVRAVGLVPVRFDVNADAGATFSAAQVSRATTAAMPGSICMAHFDRPGTETVPGMRDAIAKMPGAGATFATLGQVLV